MARFEFRLQSLIRLRERERDAASQELQKAMLASQKLLEHIEELKAEHAAQHPSQDENGAIEPQKYLEAQRYQLHLSQEIRTTQNQRELINQEVEVRRLKLVECEKAVRSVERLREIEFKEWQDQQQRAAQIALDQWAGFRYWKNQDEKPTTIPQNPNNR